MLVQVPQDMAFLDLKDFFLNTCIRYKKFQTPLKIFFNLYIQLVHVWFSLFLQQDIFVLGDIAIKLYYEKFLDIQHHSPMKFQERMEKSME